MMELSSTNLLDSLKDTKWNIAANIYGNNHATLIGLLVNWWISLAPETHQAMESGPSYGHFKRGVGGGMCDAVFCENFNAIGILEVEGTRGAFTIKKIGEFLASPCEDLKTLMFAVAVLYPVTPKGRGPKRGMPSSLDAATLAAVTKVSRKHSDKPIIVVTLDKGYERQVEGIRNRNDYYKSKLRSVKGSVYEGGKEVIPSTLLWQGRA
jgi:hypothetical protein